MMAGTTFEARLSTGAGLTGHWSREQNPSTDILRSWILWRKQDKSMCMIQLPDTCIRLQYLTRLLSETLMSLEMGTKFLV